MQNFVFENPTRVLFGKGNIARTGREIKCFGKKALLVYGSGSIKKNGVYDQVISSLNESQVPFTELPGVKSNPVLSLVYEGIEKAKGEGADVILAVGGGSVIDTAKAIAAGVMADHDVWEFFNGKKRIQAALPLVTVLTISASASEMNPAAVITNDKTSQKFSTRSMFIQPRVSILDPSTLFTISRQYTAYSAADAITHMLEGYFNNTEPHSPLQDRLVEALMRTVMESTEASLAKPDDYEARANFMWAATLAFNGMTTAGMGAVTYPAHMLGHSLSALYDTPHGASLSITLPAWMAYFSACNPRKFARLAREIFGITDPDDSAAAATGIERLRAWFEKIGTPTSLNSCSIPGSDLPAISANAHGLAQVWGLKDYSPGVIEGIFELCR